MPLAPWRWIEPIKSTVTKPANSIKDNEVLRYYEAEMRYLRDAGKEFAEAFPERARMLNIDRVRLAANFTVKSWRCCGFTSGTKQMHIWRCTSLQS